MKNKQQFKALVMEKVEQGRYRQQIKRRQTTAAVTSLCVALVLSAGVYGAWRLLPTPAKTDDIVTTQNTPSQQNGLAQMPAVHPENSPTLPSENPETLPSDPPSSDPPELNGESSSSENVADDDTQSQDGATANSFSFPLTEASPSGTCEAPTVYEYPPFPPYPIHVINVSEYMEAQLQPIGSVIADAEQVKALTDWFNNLQKNKLSDVDPQDDPLFSLSFSDGSVANVYDEFIWIHRSPHNFVYDISEQDLSDLLTMMKPQ